MAVSIGISSSNITDQGMNVSTSFLPEGMRKPGPWGITDFNLQDRLYKGNSSRLYKAIEKKSGLGVAIKIYRKCKLSILTKNQVRREVSLHQALDHPNIIKLWCAWEDDSNFYLVMELADGGDLFNKKAQFEGRTMMALEQNVVQRVILPLLGALDYLHTRGIIHRDVKLENILLSKSTAAIKLADFGLSIDSLRERPVTRVGTTEYMAPEILECPIKDYPEENKDRWDLAYDQSVDVWALGILTYELLQGQCPKDKEYVSKKVKNPQTLNLPKRLCFPTRMSPQAEDFISQILQKEASKRPSCEALLGHPWIAAFVIPSRPRLLTSLVFKDAGKRQSPPVVFSTGQTNCTQHNNPFNAVVVGANKAGANNASCLSGLDYERNYVSKEASYRRLDYGSVCKTKGLGMTAVKISPSSGPRTQPPARDQSQQKNLQIRSTLSMMNTSAGTTKASLG